jgi:hypothetical protein
MGKYDVEVAAMLSPLDVPRGRIGFRVGVRVIIDHLTVVGVDVIENTHQIGLSNNREVVWMQGSIGGWIVLHYLAANIT